MFSIMLLQLITLPSRLRLHFFFIGRCSACASSSKPSWSKTLALCGQRQTEAPQFKSASFLLSKIVKSMPARCSARAARRPVGPAPIMRTLKPDIFKHTKKRNKTKQLKVDWCLFCMKISSNPSRGPNGHGELFGFPGYDFTFQCYIEAVVNLLIGYG